MNEKTEKSKNAYVVSGAGVGAEGTEVNLATDCHPETKYKRSKIAFTVTSIALSLRHIGTRWLGLLAESQIEGPGTSIVEVPFITS